MWYFQLRFACVLASVMGILTGITAAQTAPATRRPPSPPRIDYKVLIWYRRDRPLDTFKYQIYDIRKGEYTPAVDAWIELMRSKHPAYVVMERDVDLRREKGETEALKVGSVVMRELTAAASLEGIVVGGGAQGTLSPPLASGPGRSRSSSLPGQPYSPGMTLPRSVDINPPDYSYPVPMPYPRPHP
jgi:hypothetical protein